MNGPIFTDNMNSLDRHIAQSIFNYPTLYGHRADVLNYYFCVIGNGSDWKNGVLTDHGSGHQYAQENPDRDICDEDEEVKNFLGRNEQRLSVGMAVSSSINPIIDAIFRTRARWHNMEVHYRKENAHLLAIIPSNPELEDFTLYPLCEYSSMMSVPDDVHPDWLAGVREMISIIYRMKPPTELPKGMQPHSKNIEWADKALADINARFGKPKNSYGSYTEHCEKHGARINQIFGDIKNF
jgi:hypothetical protein